MTEVMNKMMEKALSEVAPKHYLTKEGIEYFYDLDANYDDKMSERTVRELLDSDDPVMALNEKLFDWYGEEAFRIKDCIASDIMNELITYEDFVRTEDTDEEVDAFVMDRVYINYPYDHFAKQMVCVNIMMDTGDGNHDYVLNKCFPAYQESEEDVIDKKASLVWLAKTQGYSRKQLWDALLEGDMSDPHGFLESCRVEVANIASHMNLLVFMVKMSVETLFDLNQLIKLQNRKEVSYDSRNNPDCGIIEVGKDTTCGLYDPWNGGGSVLEIELEKEIKIPIRFIRSAKPDGGDGYAIESVYGLCKSEWKDSVKGIFYSNRIKDIMWNY